MNVDNSTNGSVNSSTGDVSSSGEGADRMGRKINIRRTHFPIMLAITLTVIMDKCAGSNKIIKNIYEVPENNKSGRNLNHGYHCEDFHG